jgi:hypothetical protein
MKITKLIIKRVICEWKNAAGIIKMSAGVVTIERDVARGAGL